MPPEWLRWARELAAVAETGLYYASDPAFPGSAFDAERYQTVARVAREMLAAGFDVDIDQISDRAEVGHAHETPKVDVRGAAFDDDRVLLVQERADDDRWTLPGGWVDVNESPSEAAEREFREETGLRVRATRLLALWDRDRHDHPAHRFHVYKIVFACRIVGGQAQDDTLETSRPTFWSIDELPELSTGRITQVQLRRLHAAHQRPNAATLFD